MFLSGTSRGSSWDQVSLPALGKGWISLHLWYSWIDILWISKLQNKMFWKKHCTTAIVKNILSNSCNFKFFMRYVDNVSWFLFCFLLPVYLWGAFYQCDCWFVLFSSVFFRWFDIACGFYYCLLWNLFLGQAYLFIFDVILSHLAFGIFTLDLLYRVM